MSCGNVHFKFYSTVPGVERSRQAVGLLRLQPGIRTCAVLIGIARVEILGDHDDLASA